MPRIRKKTSKRGTTRQRERIKHKVSEHHKKAKKQARKDKATGKSVQKKSKKDPGIPNDFPYKDQILAEVVEQRRQAAEERQRRKDEKRAAAASGASEVAEKSPTPEDIGEDGQGFDGVMSLRLAPTPKTRHADDAVQKQTPVVPVFPGPSTLREVVHKADLVLHVVDARDPVACMSDALVEAAQGKFAVLLNKADTVPRESLVEWLAHFRTSYTTLPFRVSSAFLPFGTPPEHRAKKAEAMPKNDALGLGGLWAYLDKLASMKNGSELIVAVTGVTNTGKSAVINSVLGSDALSIYNACTVASAQGPYNTSRAQEVVATMPGNDARKVRFIDTPGLQFVRAASITEEEREMVRARDVLLRCRGRIDRLKDPLSGVTHIVNRGDTQDLMLAYNLPAFLPGDVAGFLAGLARVSGLIKRKGVLDHAGAARTVLRDWSIGKLMRYSMPGAAVGGTTEEDAVVLGSLKSKRELRSAVEVKLLKMDAGVSDKRDVEWDIGWEEESDEEESDEEEEEEEDRDRDDSDRELGQVTKRSASKRKVLFAMETSKRRR